MHCLPKSQGEMPRISAFGKQGNLDAITHMASFPKANSREGLFS